MGLDRTWASAGLGGAAFLLLSNAAYLKFSVVASCILLLGVSFGAIAKIVGICAKRINYSRKNFSMLTQKIFVTRLESGSNPEEAKSFVWNSVKIMQEEMRQLTPWWGKWIPVLLIGRIDPHDILAPEKKAIILSQWVAFFVFCQYGAALISGLLLAAGYIHS